MNLLAQQLPVPPLHIESHPDIAYNLVQIFDKNSAYQDLQKMQMHNDVATPGVLRLQENVYDGPIVIFHHKRHDFCHCRIFPYAVIKITEQGNKYN